MANIIGRYRTLPVELFRIQSCMNVRLREHERQMKAGRKAFDLRLHEADRKVHPAEGDVFIGPNGMGMRPAGPVFAEIVANFRGSNIFVLPKGLELPTELNLLHEHSDHYSMQTSMPVSLAALNRRLTELMSGMELIDKEEYFRRFPI